MAASAYHLQTTSTSDFDRQVAWPEWIAGGIAFHPADNWVITADVQWSQWSKSESVFTATYNDPVWEKLLSASGSDKFKLNWKDATQVRVGAEYTVNADWKVRAGYYYDPAPAPDETYNILFPDVTYNAITAGASYKLTNQLFVDAGLEYEIGKDRNLTSGTYGVNIFAWSLGLSYAF